ncbi:MAG: cytochrome c oxidase subunit 4 [Microbacteriaceae bacterium]|jgi:hypothetical protein|nr:cytochrome c oxidase subunit 4 [Microbacteriaceae bacterium]
MRANINLFWILAAFCGAADALYIIWSLADKTHGGVIEWVGTLAIGLSGILAAFIAFYISRVHAGQGGALPEDRLDANIDDGEAEQGFFSPWSWWPVMLASSLALMFLGLAVGVWIAFVGAALVIISLVGWVYEYYRGNFAH